MKKTITYATMLFFLSSCAKQVYSSTENDITRSGIRVNRRHIEVISVTLHPARQLAYKK